MIRGNGTWSRPLSGTVEYDEKIDWVRPNMTDRVLSTRNIDKSGYRAPYHSRVVYRSAKGTLL
jgi:hypothetical protein